MAETSKILTVSYGTFSCTLEGFDDAFDTMKAIAEYFRDLAADDRYFGAEPPTPDPEMLARIAERDIERRVEARLEKSGYVLRPAALAAVAPDARTDEDIDEGRAAKTDVADDDTQPAAAAEADETAAEPAQIAETQAEAATARPEADRPEADKPEADQHAADTKSSEPAGTTGGDPDEALAPDYDPEADTRPWAQLNTAERRLRRQVRRARRAAATTEAEAEAETGLEAAADGPGNDGAQTDTVTSDTDTAIEPDTTGTQDVQDGAVISAGEEAGGDGAGGDGAGGDRAKTDQPADEATAGSQEPAESETSPEETAAGRTEAAAPDAPDTSSGDTAEAEPAADSAAAAAADTETGPDTPADLAAAEAAKGTAETRPDAETQDDETQDDAASAFEPAEPPTIRTSGRESVAAKLARIRAVVGGARARTEDAAAAAGPVAPPAGQPSETAGEPAAETPERERIRARVVRMRRSEFEAQITETEVIDSGAPQSEVTEMQVTGIRETETEIADAGAAGADSEAGEAALTEAETEAESGEMAIQDMPAEEIADAADRKDLARLDGIEDLESDIAADAEAGALAPDEEAALLDELAELERTAGPENAPRATEDEIPEIAEAEPEEEDGEAAEAAGGRRNRAAFLAGSPDSDGMERILTETDAQLQEPEGNRRREAIAHLKAAVAATEAARQLGEDDGSDEGENMFREDLDHVVRPRRTSRPVTRSDRPRAAPLKLVASQRVDVPPADDDADATDMHPVMPRRVQPGAAPERSEEASATAESFARFAADAGATGLGDLLEAAAAHSAFVEDQPDVSRPQIMKSVQAILPEGFSREDGLRAFGTLLRQGRIEKVRNGRFRVSAQSRFNPQRAASGS